MRKRTYPSWDAAGHAARSYQSPKPHKMHGPVGKPCIQLLDEVRTAGLDLDMVAFNSAETVPKCRDCGYHICCCTAAAPAPIDAWVKHVADHQDSWLNSILLRPEVGYASNRPNPGPAGPVSGTTAPEYNFPILLDLERGV